MFFVEAVYYDRIEILDAFEDVAAAERFADDFNALVSDVEPLLDGLKAFVREAGSRPAVDRDALFRDAQIAVFGEWSYESVEEYKDSGAEGCGDEG